MNYSEIHNFYEDKEVHSNINYTLKKYNVTTQSSKIGYTYSKEG